MDDESTKPPEMTEKRNAGENERQFELYNSNQVFIPQDSTQKTEKDSVQLQQTVFNTPSNLNQLSQDARMFSPDANMLSILSSVTTSIADSRDDNKEKGIESVQLKPDTQNMRDNILATSSSSSSSSSSSNDEDEDSDAESSELDEEDCDRIRSQCLDEMSTIEKQFTDIKDQLYKERHSQITCKLKEVESEMAEEYLNPFEKLQQNLQTRMEVCEISRKLRIESIKCWYQAQKQANKQHFENDKQMMTDAIRAELEEKIRKLEEDRDNVDFSTELWTALGHNHKYRSMVGWSKNQSSRRSKKEQPFNFGFNTSNSLKRKKKPVTVTGPYIVYMLRESDVLHDWTIIKRALTASKRRMSGFKEKPSKSMRRLHSCRIENDKLLYDGRWFHRGQGVALKSKDIDSNATINSIGNNEVNVQHTNGTNTKLHVQQLVRGKFSIRAR